jgi:hypothetical protein
MLVLADSWGVFCRVILSKPTLKFDTNYCKSKDWKGLSLLNAVVRDHLKHVIISLSAGARPGYSIVRGI